MTLGILPLQGVPSEFGAFGTSREMAQADLQSELDQALKVVVAPTIVLSHCPPFGARDQVEDGMHIGHRPLAAFLESPPGASVELVLCGHVHEGNGIGRCGGALVLNVATGFAVITREAGGWEVEVMRAFQDLLGEEAFDELP